MSNIPSRSVSILSAAVAAALLSFGIASAQTTNTQGAAQSSSANQTAQTQASTSSQGNQGTSQQGASGSSQSSTRCPVILSLSMTTLVPTAN
ncbi:MAG: hypothetical protein ACP5GF_13085, partial [Thiomonas sp.]